MRIGEGIEANGKYYELSESSTDPDLRILDLDSLHKVESSRADQSGERDNFLCVINRVLSRLPLITREVPISENYGE